VLLDEKKVWAREDAELVKDLRSDHAGETGAVYIYVGAEAAMRLGPPERFTDGARAFVQAHKATEEKHLAYFDRLLDTQRSKLLPLWRLSGFALGFLPTLVGGERALFCTVEAVEAFVEVHYNQHILPLAARPPGPYSYPELLRLLRACCEDEVHHKEDACSRWLAAGEERPLWARVWAGVVGKGSAAAVAVCRNV
jgi:3-demethoxyubiquinol 3-hydroxylase